VESTARATLLVMSKFEWFLEVQFNRKRRLEGKSAMSLFDGSFFREENTYYVESFVSASRFIGHNAGTAKTLLGGLKRSLEVYMVNSHARDIKFARHLNVKRGICAATIVYCNKKMGALADISLMERVNNDNDSLLNEKGIFNVEQIGMIVPFLVSKMEYLLEKGSGNCLNDLNEFNGCHILLGMIERVFIRPGIFRNLTILSLQFYRCEEMAENEGHHFTTQLNYLSKFITKEGMERLGLEEAYFMTYSKAEKVELELGEARDFGKRANEMSKVHLEKILNAFSEGQAMRLVGVITGQKTVNAHKDDMIRFEFPKLWTNFFLRREKKWEALRERAGNFVSFYLDKNLNPFSASSFCRLVSDTPKLLFPDFSVTPAKWRRQTIVCFFTIIGFYEVPAHVMQQVMVNLAVLGRTSDSILRNSYLATQRGTDTVVPNMMENALAWVFSGQRNPFPRRPVLNSREEVFETFFLLFQQVLKNGTEDLKKIIGMDPNHPLHKLLGFVPSPKELEESTIELSTEQKGILEQVLEQQQLGESSHQIFEGIFEEDFQEEGEEGSLLSKPRKRKLGEKSGEKNGEKNGEENGEENGEKSGEKSGEQSSEELSECIEFEVKRILFADDKNQVAIVHWKNFDKAESDTVEGFDSFSHNSYGLIVDFFNQTGKDGGRILRGYLSKSRKSGGSHFNVDRGGYGVGVSARICLFLFSNRQFFKESSRNQVFLSIPRSKWWNLGRKTVFKLLLLPWTGIRKCLRFWEQRS
jgi:hypothetical protein